MPLATISQCFLIKRFYGESQDPGLLQPFHNRNTVTCPWIGHKRGVLCGSIGSNPGSITNYSAHLRSTRDVEMRSQERSMKYGVTTVGLR